MFTTSLLSAIHRTNKNDVVTTTKIETMGNKISLSERTMAKSTSKAMGKVETSMTFKSLRWK